MSISRRISIRWLPAPASEPTSTLVLTSPARRFIDIRLTPPTPSPSHPQSLYWGFTGLSSNPTPTSGRWTHEVDSRGVSGFDEGSLSTLPNGDVLENGSMVDFDDADAGAKAYEEVWRDEESATVVVLEEVDGAGGRVVRVGEWCHGLIARDKAVHVERWRDGVCVFRSAGTLAREIVPPDVWKHEELAMGRVLQHADVVWKVVELHL